MKKLLLIKCKNKKHFKEVEQFFFKKGIYYFENPVIQKICTMCMDAFNYNVNIYIYFDWDFISWTTGTNYKRFKNYVIFDEIEDLACTIEADKMNLL